jgi:cytochrome c oxidase cbb3-type subunit 4
MEKYSLLREIADSWVLLGMFAFFIGAVLWAFRPSGRKTYRDTADIPFRHEDKPAPSADAKEAQQ